MEKNKRVATLLNPPNSFVGTPSAFCLRTSAFLTKYASWLDQIEIWFSILQRKLLTPNDFPDLKTLQQRIADFIARHNDSAKPIKWSYTVAQMMENFATN